MKLIGIVGKKRSGKDTIARQIGDNDEINHWQHVKTYAFADPFKLILNKAYNDLDLHLRSGLELCKDHFYDGGVYGKSRYNDHLMPKIDRDTTPILLSNKDVLEWMQATIKLARLELGLKIQPLKKGGDDLVIDKLIMQNKDTWTLRKIMQTFATDIVVNLFDTNFWNRLAANEIIDALNSNKKYFIISDVRQQHEIDFLRMMGFTMLFVERDDVDLTKRKDDHISEQMPQRLEHEILIKNNGSLEDLTNKLKELGLTK